MASCQRPSAVLLAQRDRRGVALVGAVQVRRDAPELEQLVLLQLLRQRDLVEGVVVGDALAQLVEVLLLDEQLVDVFVDHGDVVALHVEQVLLDQRLLALEADRLHHALVVQLGTARGPSRWASAGPSCRPRCRTGVVRVEEDRLLPVQVVLARMQQRRDAEARPEEVDVLHQLDLLVLGV